MTGLVYYPVNTSFKHMIKMGAYDISHSYTQAFFEFLFMEFSIQIILLCCNKYSKRLIQ